MYICFIYALPTDKTVELFPPLAIVSNTVYEHSYTGFCVDMFSFLLGVSLEKNSCITW